MNLGMDQLRDHVQRLQRALVEVDSCLPTIAAWGRRLAERLTDDGRLLVAGNGGSAAQAQHLTSEIVGRFVTDRPPFSAIALPADSSATTAIVNDYGADALFARQVQAHGREGDILLLVSTSGRSANIIDAADAGFALGLQTWALTGPPPTPLAARVDDVLACPAETTATVQEVHQLLIHLLCVAFEAALAPESRNGRHITHAVRS
jgi:D-sedoheptulose 7-phosphate isomerase